MREREIEFKELAHTVVEMQVQNLQRRPATWKSRKETQSSSKAICWQNFFLFRGDQSLLYLGLQQLDEAPPHHGWPSALLKIYQFIANLIQKIPA